MQKERLSEIVGLWEKIYLYCEEISQLKLVQYGFGYETEASETQNLLIALLQVEELLRTCLTNRQIDLDPPQFGGIKEDITPRDATDKIRDCMEEAQSSLKAQKTYPGKCKQAIRGGYNIVKNALIEIDNDSVVEVG